MSQRRNCCYCGESDSIDHTFIECQFTKSFTQEVLQWLNVNNSSNFILNAEDVLFGLSSASDTLTKKLNYILVSSCAIIFINVSSKITHHHYRSLILSIKINTSIKSKRLFNILKHKVPPLLLLVSLFLSRI